jgi:hypothetical protein
VYFERQPVLVKGYGLVTTGTTSFELIDDERRIERKKVDSYI